MAERGFKAWCETTALQVRRQMRLQAVDPLAPEQFAAHLGIMLCTPADIPGLPSASVRVLLREEQDSWSAVTISSSDRDLVIYNSAHSPGRRANDIMHELAHIVLGHDPARVMFFADGQTALRTFNEDQEGQATWLAGCLLLPRAALIQIIANRLDEEATAHRYHVSVQLLRYRLNVTGVNLQFSRGRSPSR